MERFSFPFHNACMENRSCCYPPRFVGNFLAVIYKDHSETEDKISGLNNTVLSLKKDSAKLEELSYQLNEAREVIGLLQEGNSKLQSEVDLLRGKGKSIDADRPRLQVTGSSFEKIADGDRLVIFYKNYGRSVAKDIDSTVVSFPVKETVSKENFQRFVWR